MEGKPYLAPFLPAYLEAERQITLYGVPSGTPYNVMLQVRYARLRRLARSLIATIRSLQDAR